MLLPCRFIENYIYHVDKKYSFFAGEIAIYILSHENVKLQ